MDKVALFIMVAIVLEALIEYVKTIYKMVEDKQYKTAITQGITIALGVGLAFLFNLHLFDDCLSEIYEGLYINPTIDTILTGILFSRGANYFSDLVSKLTKPVATTSGYVAIANPDDLVYDPSSPTETLSSDDGKMIDDEEEE